MEFIGMSLVWKLKGSHKIFDEQESNALHRKIILERGQSKHIFVIFDIYFKKTVRNKRTW